VVSSPVCCNEIARMIFYKRSLGVDRDFEVLKSQLSCAEVDLLTIMLFSPEILFNPNAPT
jgi:hypothetical protein